jgi:uncharacterized damage-inducible protein DinB
MTQHTTAGVDLAPVWARFNEGLIRLVDYVPDDKLNWSPKPELWNFRGIMLHIANARDNWLTGAGDGIEAPNVWMTVRSKDEIKASYARTWERLVPFLDDRSRLDRDYVFNHPDGVTETLNGHWIAFHLLEHDIHHRADLFHYLALLGIEHPDIGTP